MTEYLAILIAPGWAAAALFFALLWLEERRTNDASWVDAGWSFAIGALAVFYALAAPGLPERRFWLGLLVGIWSLRLTAHILTRHAGGPEDDRYRKLRVSWKERAHFFFFWFYQAQALLAAVLSIPFALIAFNRNPSLESLEVAGLLLAAAGLVGETVADRQLSRHRQDPENAGKTCRSGLWRLSRHPNYFFEWLIWCGFGLVALAAPYGWVGLVSPLLMLYLIVYVTGIPPSEARALESRGDDYRRYQATTSAFVPWFPKKETTA